MFERILQKKNNVKICEVYYSLLRKWKTNKL